MTTRAGKVVIIAAEAARKCELCGATEECRPYGPNGEQVCFPCGQKHPEALQRAMDKLFEGTKKPTCNGSRCPNPVKAKGLCTYHLGEFEALQRIAAKGGLRTRNRGGRS